MEKYIDLHVHTTASDGSMTPSQVIVHASENGLAGIAITDHDTISGVEEAVKESITAGIQVIPGIEISVDYEPEMHILGYGLNIYSAGLNESLNKLKRFRKQRNPEIIQKLNSLGLEISIDEVMEEAGSGTVGRPHIAGVLVKKGYVGTVEEAFENYLAAGKPAYVDRQKLSPKQGIQLIKNAGGLAVIAHPNYLKKDDTELELLLQELIEIGLDGIEAYYPEYTLEMHVKYKELAEKYNLIITGGSDFHGETKPQIQIGKGYGELKVPYSLLDKLNKRQKRAK